MSRFYACNHAESEPWKQRVVNGPFRSKCGGCGRVLKYSAEVNVYKRPRAAVAS